MALEEIKILDVKINALNKAEVLDLIKNLLIKPDSSQQQLVTTNPEFIMAAQEDLEFKNIINNAWLSVVDGYGIRLAAKYLDLIKNNKKNNLLLGLKIAWWGIARNNKKLNIVPETITGTDLVPEIVRIMNCESGIMNKKVFLLGGFGEISRLTAERLSKVVIPSGVERSETKSRNPVEFRYSTFETDNIIEKINSFAPSILFVALNHPRAQKWIDANLIQIPSVKLAVGVGGAFDYISGQIKRAPQCLQGFEWLYRLFTQPRRFKRIYTAVIKFPWFVFKSNFS